MEIRIPEQYRIGLYVQKDEKGLKGIDSIQTQLQALSKTAAKYGIVVDTYIEMCSSTLSLQSRPELQRLLNDMKNRAINLIIATEWIRLCGAVEPGGEIGEIVRSSGADIITLDNLVNTTDKNDFLLKHFRDIYWSSRHLGK